MLNQVLKVSSRTFQQSVEVLLESVTFLDFRLSQGSVAIYCRWGGNLCDVYIKNFLTNHLVKLEIGLHLQNWHGISKCTVFIGPPCTIPAITTNLQNQHKTAWNDAFQIQTEIYHSHRMRQLCHIFSLLRQKRAAFWSARINADQHQPSRLWRSFDELLGRGRAPVVTDISTSVLHDFFDDKLAGAGRHC